MHQLLKWLGLVPRGGNYESVRRRIAELGLDASHLRRRGRGIAACSDEEVIQAVRVSRSLAGVLRELRVGPGGNQFRLRQRIARLGIDTSHLSGQGWRKGSTTPVVPPRPLEQVLVLGGLFQTNNLKQRLFDAGLKEKRCELCRLGSWNGEPIPLELDHVNGRRDDNRLPSLRVLCPNCHAQTPTYRGRNIGLAESLS